MVQEGTPLPEATYRHYLHREVIIRPIPRNSGSRPAYSPPNSSARPGVHGFSFNPWRESLSRRINQTFPVSRPAIFSAIEAVKLN